MRLDTSKPPRGGRRPNPFQLKTTKHLGNPVGKATQVAGRRIGGALRAEQQRQQARRDAKR